MIRKEITAITAERKAAVKKLLDLSHRDSFIETSRCQDGKVHLHIHPPTELAACDWEMVLFQGQKLKIVNNETFSFSKAGAHKTSVRWHKDEDEPNEYDDSPDCWGCPRYPRWP